MNIKDPVDCQLLLLIITTRTPCVPSHVIKSIGGLSNLKSTVCRPKQPDSLEAHLLEVK